MYVRGHNEKYAPMLDNNILTVIMKKKKFVDILKFGPLYFPQRTILSSVELSGKYHSEKESILDVSLFSFKNATTAHL